MKDEKELVLEVFFTIFEEGFFIHLWFDFIDRFARIDIR